MINWATLKQPNGKLAYYKTLYDEARHEAQDEFSPALGRLERWLERTSPIRHAIGGIAAGSVTAALLARGQWMLAIVTVVAMFALA
jgi:hypothetical protein